MKHISVFAALLLTLGTLVAQDESGSPEQVAVTKGEAVVESVKYPVFGKITSVEKSQFGGIRYAVAEANAKAAGKKADQIKKFYQNRKIGKVKFGTFKKISKPDTVAWVATAGKGEAAMGVVVKVDGSQVVVYVLPQYGEGTLAMIL